MAHRVEEPLDEPSERVPSPTSAVLHLRAFHLLAMYVLSNVGRACRYDQDLHPSRSYDSYGCTYPSQGFPELSFQRRYRGLQAPERFRDQRAREQESC